MYSDLRSWASPIRNQGSCGSCTAFGTIGAWEPYLRIKENNKSYPIDLSERDLFSCAGGSCLFGSQMKPILNRALEGVCTEECCPYDAKDHLCSQGCCEEWWMGAKKLIAWERVTNILDMKSILDTVPLITTMAVHQSFMNYKSGVYHSLENDPVIGYHCIAVLGYSDELEAWLIRNSWGIGWGMEGYAWVKYSDSEIDKEMYRIIPDGEIPPEPRPPIPSPCKLGNFIAKLINLIAKLFRRKGRFYYLNNYKSNSKV